MTFRIRWPLQAQQVDRNLSNLAAIASPPPLPAENLLQSAREENTVLLERLNTTPEGLSELTEHVQESVGDSARLTGGTFSTERRQQGSAGHPQHDQL